MKRKYFLDAVRLQMKSEKAKKYIVKELDHHIASEKAYWLKKGLIDSEAEEKAVQQMGSPLLLGQQLNKIHRPKVDWWLLIIVSIIISLGFLPLLQDSFQTDTLVMIKKTMMTIIGLCFIIGLMFLDYTKLRKYGWLFYGVALFIQFYLFFFVETLVNGSPILMLGPLSIEDTICLPFFWIGFACLLSNEKQTVSKTILLFAIPYILYLLLYNDHNALIYSVMVVVMIWINAKGYRKRIKILAPISIILLGSLIYIWLFAENIHNRLMGYSKPEQFTSDEGYFYLIIKQQLQHLNWFGKSDMQLFLYEGHTDFVFLNLLAQYGLVLSFFIILILLLLISRLIAVSNMMKDSFGKLLTIGGIALITIELIYNIGMNFGYLPLAGMPLPFISYGLMPTLIHAIVIGVVLSAYRQKDLQFNIHS